MEEKKVVVANYRFHITGGPEVYLFKFIDRCQSIGYKPIPFSVKYKKNVETPFSKYFISNRGEDGLYYENIGHSPKAIWKTLQGAYYNKEAVKNLNKLIRDERPSVLYALQVINTLSPSVFKAAKKKGLKVIHRISDFNLVCPRSDFLRNEQVCELCLKGNFKYGKKYKCYHNSKLASWVRCSSMKYHRRKKLYQYVDYFVTPTQFTRNKLIAGGFPQEKVVHIPTFIDATTITPNYENYDYLLFLGRLVPEKGAKYAIEAMKYLDEFPTLKLKITGNLTEKDEELKRLIQENHLEDRIEFTGFVKGKELETLISHSMVILCPAIWYENMPNTVIEAYAYGKPVIASRFGCFPELIEEGKTGYLFEPKNSFELAEKIKMINTNQELLKILGKNAREKVERDFNSEQHFSKLKKLFEA